MELLEEILKFSIGGLTITGIIVYLGKLILTKSSDILIENHKNQLELSKAEHQNQLEILQAEHQIRFSKLHSERGEIIKLIYQDFYDLEQKLEKMTTLFQGSEWRTEKTRDDEAIEKYRQAYDRLEGIEYILLKIYVINYLLVWKITAKSLNKCYKLKITQNMNLMELVIDFQKDKVL